MYFLKNLLLYSQALIRQTKYVVMMTKEGSTKIVKFMTPGVGVSYARAWPYKSYSKLHYFFKKSSLFPGIDQTNQVCRNDDQGRATKIVNFMTPGAGVLVLGCGHISHIVKLRYFFNNLLLYSQA